MDTILEQFVSLENVKEFIRTNETYIKIKYGKTKYCIIVHPKVLWNCYTVLKRFPLMMQSGSHNKIIPRLTFKG